MELIRQRRPQGAEGMRQEWAGLKNVPTHLIDHALGNTAVPTTDPELAKRNAEAIKRDTDERERNAQAAKKQDDAITRTTQDAAFEQSLIGKSVGDQARLRTAYQMTNDVKAQGIDLNSRLAGSEKTLSLIHI